MMHLLYFSAFSQCVSTRTTPFCLHPLGRSHRGPDAAGGRRTAQDGDAARLATKVLDESLPGRLTRQASIFKKTGARQYHP